MSRFLDTTESWIETSNGNRISRYAEIRGGQKITLSGFCVLSENCKLLGNVAIKNGDDPAISMGLLCIVGKDCVLRPPRIGFKTDNYSESKVPVHSSLCMGSFILIGSNCEISCKQIGRRVVLGCNVVLSRGCELGDVIIVDKNVQIPEKCKVPSYSRVQRHPIIPGSVSFTSLPGSMRKCIEEWCRMEYMGLPVDLEQMVSQL
ncbi:LAQU0S04e04236g1_1 [Lachancea quebecensis]|uniref:Dynactin subunit 5 n=1 Tax=Lachancea quebecensis TaxID=1654605 RepID=A0A0P1KQI0_9SACH|nr:LAQU0S04e04236g1_1 [Lachancea quebecensis]